MNLRPIFQALFIVLSSITVVTISFLALKEAFAERVSLILLPEGKDFSDPIVIRSRKVTIGRGPECSLQIFDPFVSSRHSLIFRKGVDFYLKDLGSKNGTKVNGVDIETIKVKNGDIIRIGEKEFKVMIA